MLTNTYENGNGNGNGHKPKSTFTKDVTTVVVDPEDRGKKTRQELEDDLLDMPLNEDIELGDDDKPITPDIKRPGQDRGLFKRIAIAGLVILCMAIFVSVGAYFVFFRASRNQQTTLKVKVGNDTKGQAAEADTKIVTADEIARDVARAKAEAKAAESIEKNGGMANQPTDTKNPNPTIGPTGQPSISQSYDVGRGSPITSRPPVDSFSSTVTQPESTQQQGQTTQHTDNKPLSDSATASANHSSVPHTGVTPVNGGYVSSSFVPHSIRIGTLPVVSSSPSKPNSPVNNSSHVSRLSEVKVERPQTQKAKFDIRKPQVAIPPLGTMLPVRTLGRVYTLRTSALVRMQLTRAVEGKGWSLQRGTELYGTLQNSDFEIGRAYISLIGFIDPETKRMVRLSGSLLGSDGTDGLIGKKHKIGSGWGRALRIATAGAVEAFSAAITNIGRRPIVVTDVYGYGSQRAMSPLMNELNGLANGGKRSGYVEVPAGTSGYILVMTMPSEIKGVEANDLSNEDLQQLSDTSLPRSTTHLSDDELSELISNGSPEAIRQAIPRMSPEMRRVAELAISQIESGTYND
jgi:hypothetical protein